MENSWEICKQAVNTLSSDFEQVIRNIDAKTPYNIHRIKRNSGQVITAFINKIQGCDTELSVIYHKGKGIVGAKYYAFNEKDMRVYIRDLLNLELPSI